MDRKWRVFQILLNRTTIEVKNIDPPSTREDLVGDICGDLDIQDPKLVDNLNL